MAGSTRDRRRGWLGRAPGTGRPIIGMHAGSRPDIEAPDPLEAPRTVRRSLADARQKATEVERLICSDRLAGDDARAFARTALGPTGDSVALEVAPDGQVLEAALGGAGGIVVAIAIPGGVPFAFCLGPREGASADEAGYDADGTTGDEERHRADPA